MVAIVNDRNRDEEQYSHDISLMHLHLESVCRMQKARSPRKNLQGKLRYPTLEKATPVAFCKGRLSAAFERRP